MKSFIWALAGTAMLFSTATYAQEDAVDAEVFEAGQEIFETNCAQCHQSDGSGMSPAFPALDGNDTLDDLENVVATIHEGRNAMPPFPQFGVDDLTAVTTYIRNAWSNEFGPVEADEISGIIGEAEEEAANGEGPVSSWDGVFTAEQAARGQSAYDGACAMCHGRRLDGAAGDPDMQSGPPLARYAFLRDWDGRSVGAVYDYSRTTMPEANPGSLSDQQYVDIVAYMLSASGMPEGDEELPPDSAALSNIRIDEEAP